MRRSSSAVHVSAVGKVVENITNVDERSDQHRQNAGRHSSRGPPLFIEVS